MTASVKLTEISISQRHVAAPYEPPGPTKYAGTVKLQAFSESLKFDFEMGFADSHNLDNAVQNAATKLKDELVELLTEVLKIDGGHSGRTVSISP